MSHPDDRRSRRQGAVLGALAGAMFLLYLVNGARYLGADTMGAPYTALSLLRDGDFYIDNLVRDQPRSYWTEPGRNGTVSVYGFGPPLLAVPVYQVFDWVVWHGRWTENRLLVTGKVAGALMTALAALLLGLTARRIAPFGAAVAVMLVFGLCSPAWSVTSQALWKHSPAIFLLAAGLAMLLWPARATPPRPLIPLSAVPLALSVWCRENLAMVVVAAAVYLWFVRGRATAAWFAGIAAVVVAGLVALNLAHFGQPLHSGVLAHSIAVARQQGKEIWDTPVWLGLYGLFLSPSRGLLVFAPVFLASFWGAWLGLRGRDGERPAYLFLAAGAILAFAPSVKWHFWWGGAAFGPRLLVDAMPFFTLLALPVWSRLVASRTLSAAAAALALFSALVQGIGAFKYDGLAWDERPGGQSVDSRPERLLSWSDSQLVYYLRLPDTKPQRIPWR